MSRLLKLKSWLSIYEAAFEIQSTLKESVSASDVLRLALDGHLKLSIHLVNGAHGCLCNPVSDTDIKWQEAPSLDGQRVIRLPENGRVFQAGEVTYQVSESVVSLRDGIWDLPMFGGERIDVKFRYQQLKFEPGPTAVSVDGVFIQNVNGDLYEVQSEFEKRRTAEGGKPVFGSANFHPAGALPKDSVLVIRSDALKDFLRSFTAIQPSNEKTLGNKERNTLLAIIAALCKDAGYDVTKHAKTAGLIESTAAKMGVSIGETTIEGHLKGIPDALATRMK